MYYHASPAAGIRLLEPRVSNHNVPLIYFSKKRENVLIYLSNAVEKYCKDTGYVHSGKWTKWAPYGFQHGIQRLDEYYPNALAETYQGVSGYIYHASTIQEAEEEISIPDAAVSSLPVPVDDAEFVPDAYEAILEAERLGKIFITRYEALTEKNHAWIRENMQREYDIAGEHPEYRYFLVNKFDFIQRAPQIKGLPMTCEIFNLREHIWLMEQAAEWFHAKWGVPLEAYRESMAQCVKGEGPVPQWYVAMDGKAIIGGLGVIENDFHSRKDLSPNVCAVYVEEPYRCQGVAGALLNHVCQDMADMGIDTLYLLTDHASFYERYGWEFLCMVQGDGDEKPSRMYVHHWNA